MKKEIPINIIQKHSGKGDNRISITENQSVDAFITPITRVLASLSIRDTEASIKAITFLQEINNIDKETHKLLEILENYIQDSKLEKIESHYQKRDRSEFCVSNR